MAAKKATEEKKAADSSSPKFVTVETGDSTPAASSDAPATTTVTKPAATTSEPATTTSTDSEAKPDVSNHPTSFSQLDADKPEAAQTAEAPAAASATPDTADESQITPTLSETPADTTTSDSSTPAEGTPASEESNDWLGTEGVGDDAESGGKGKRIAIIIVVLLLITGAIAGGVYYYRNSIESKEVASEVIITEPDLVEENEPTPTAVPEEVDLTEVSVSILNGSGIPGEAGEVEDLLVDAGFTDIDTGNAESYDFLDTGISVRSGLSAYVYNSIEDALGADYKVVESDELDEDSTFDVIIIVGSEGPDEEEAEPTETPTETPTPTPEE